MKQLYEKFKELIDYMLFGAGAMLLNFGIFFLLSTIIGLHYMIANIVAIACAIIFSFFGNKKYVFKKRSATKGSALREFMLFVTFRAGFILIEMVSLYTLVSIVQLGENSSKLLIEICISIGNFLLSKFVIFKKNNE